jgi:hypothetical protein
MLKPIAPELWCAIHRFKSMGLELSSRMTVVRFPDRSLWLHSPIALNDALKAELNALGRVRWIVAPNLAHHLFAGDALAAYPEAELWGAPGLKKKRPDLTSMRPLPREPLAEWASELDQVLVEGMPLVRETVWFHKSSGTLIATDLCMWFQGEWPWLSRVYGHLNGVMNGLAVSRLVRLVTRDKPAAAGSCLRILAWPIKRVVMAHDSIVEVNAKKQLAQALACFGRPSTPPASET